MAGESFGVDVECGSIVGFVIEVAQPSAPPHNSSSQPWLRCCLSDIGFGFGRENCVSTQHCFLQSVNEN